VVTEATLPPRDAMDNPRIARLLKAEQACLDAGGCCLRLAGLYNSERGAHNYWITSGKAEIESRGDCVINCLHYDDAASACAAALRAGPEICRGRVFLVSDGHPMTRQEICQSALQARAYRGRKAPKFVGTEDALGKVYDGTMTNQLLDWSPKYESLDAFMKQQA